MSHTSPPNQAPSAPDTPPRGGRYQRRVRRVPRRPEGSSDLGRFNPAIASASLARSRAVSREPRGTAAIASTTTPADDSPHTSRRLRHHNNTHCPDAGSSGTRERVTKPLRP
jgi:hypothetical protein